MRAVYLYRRTPPPHRTAAAATLSIARGGLYLPRAHHSMSPRGVVILTVAFALGLVMGLWVGIKYAHQRVGPSSRGHADDATASSAIVPTRQADQCVDTGGNTIYLNAARATYRGHDIEPPPIALTGVSHTSGGTAVARDLVRLTDSGRVFGAIIKALVPTCVATTIVSTILVCNSGADRVLATWVSIVPSEVDTAVATQHTLDAERTLHGCTRWTRPQRTTTRANATETAPVEPLNDTASSKTKAAPALLPTMRSLRAALGHWDAQCQIIDPDVDEHVRWGLATEGNAGTGAAAADDEGNSSGDEGRADRAWRRTPCCVARIDGTATFVYVQPARDSPVSM